METVAQFINGGSPRQALARLCRLAVEPTADGRRLLDDWEERRPVSAAELSKTLTRLEDGSQIVEATEIAADPLLWLRALDKHCHQTISPASYFTDAAIEDGSGTSRILPLHPGQGGGARNRQFGNLAKWLKHHRAIPLDNPQGIPVAVAGLPHGYADWTERATAGDVVTIAIVHFTDGVRPETDNSRPAHFICSKLSDEKQRFDSVVEHIRAAKAGGTHILIMPELCLTSKIRAQITETLIKAQAENGDDHRLSVPIIVLGSAHQATGAGWCNRAAAISGMDGALLFECDKRKSVTFTFPGESDARKEDIQCAPTPLTCLFTPIGLIAMAICKDLFDEEPAAVLSSLPLDWLLVPSMSNSLGPHKAAAKTLHDTGGTVVAVANQEMPGSQKPRPGFVRDTEMYECQAGLHVISVPRAKPVPTASNTGLYLRRVK